MSGECYIEEARKPNPRRFGDLPFSRRPYGTADGVLGTYSQDFILGYFRFLATGEMAVATVFMRRPYGTADGVLGTYSQDFILGYFRFLPTGEMAGRGLFCAGAQITFNWNLYL